MKFSSLLIALTALSSLPLLPCGAQTLSDHNYVFITQGNKVSVFVDSTTIQTTASGRIFWELEVTEPADHLSDGKVYRYTLSQVSIDCDARTIKNLSGAFYLTNGEVVDSYENVYGMPTTIFPDSIGDGLFSALCHPDFPGDRMAYKMISSAIVAGEILLFPPPPPIKAKH